MLDHLAKERDDSLGAVSVWSWQVDFVAEQNKPPSDLGRRESGAIQRLLVLALLFKGLDKKLGTSSAGEVEADDFQRG